MQVSEECICECHQNPKKKPLYKVARKYGGARHLDRKLIYHITTIRQRKTCILVLKIITENRELGDVHNNEEKSKLLQKVFFYEPSNSTSTTSTQGKNLPSTISPTSK